MSLILCKVGVIIKSRPLIALAVSLDSESRVCVKQEYLNAIWQYGGIGVVSPYETDMQRLQEFCNVFDGFLFCGGDDIDPKYYGEENYASKNICSTRDRFEFAFLHEAVKTEKPILGICRGAQLINVYFGGSLCQHIDNHNLTIEKGVHLHSINIIEKSHLYSIVDKSTFLTNSFHHQCVNKLGSGLEINALCNETIEAFNHKQYPYCFAVQWHPEKSPNDKLNAAIFKEFINRTK